VANLDGYYGIDDRTEAFENHRRGLLVSLAGPGTGKTYSFLKRIISLVSDQRAAPPHICYLTFIKEIANAFLSDYHQEFPGSQDDPTRPRISTLHSLACRLIRNRGFSIGYDGSLYFASIADREAIAAKVFLADLLPFVRTAGLKTVPQLRNLLQRVKGAWRDNVDPHTLDEPTPVILRRCLRLGRAYRLIDWDQAITVAHELFLDPGNRQQWLTQLRHYLVDEYQDFNKAEQAFISTLATTVASMVIVGDDNQSIFSGRGGSPAGMRRLFQDPGCDQVTLSRCRRCKSNILNSANRFLLAMAPGSQPMLPYHDGGEVNCFRFKSAKAETAFLVQYLATRLRQLPDNPTPKHGVVCLFPTRKALGAYFDSVRLEIPCHTKKVELHPLRQSLMLLLELVCNPDQRFIERLILESFQDIKPRHKKQMVQLLLQNDISPLQAIESLIKTGGISGAAAEAARSFIELCRTLCSGDPATISIKIAQRFDLEPAEIRPLIEELLNRIGEADQEDLISSICDRAVPESALRVEDPRSVLFLTMHGSKGLTRETVVLPGLEDAWLPGDASGADLDERKRLFYVAITRATDHLLITFPGTRGRGDPLNYRAAGRGQVSRFVRDAGIATNYHK
jgi:DNA helicase II / ATP-dependent DNA helicase PcrA